MPVHRGFGRKRGGHIKKYGAYRPARGGAPPWGGPIRGLYRGFWRAFSVVQIVTAKSAKKGCFIGVFMGFRPKI